MTAALLQAALDRTRTATAQMAETVTFSDMPAWTPMNVDDEDSEDEWVERSDSEDDERSSAEYIQALARQEPQALEHQKFYDKENAIASALSAEAMTTPTPADLGWAGAATPTTAEESDGKFGSKTADSQELSFHSCDARDGLDHNGRTEHLQGRRLGLTVDVVNRDLCWKV